MLKVQMNMKSMVLCQSNVSLDLQSTLLLLVLVSAKITVDLGLDRKGFEDQGWWQRKLIGHEFDFYIELWQCLLFFCVQYLHVAIAYSLKKLVHKTGSKHLPNIIWWVAAIPVVFQTWTPGSKFWQNWIGNITIQPVR